MLIVNSPWVHKELHKTINVGGGVRGENNTETLGIAAISMLSVYIDLYVAYLSVILFYESILPCVFVIHKIGSQNAFISNTHSNTHSLYMYVYIIPNSC